MRTARNPGRKTCRPPRAAFLRQNLSGIPTALVEAAKIDGCGYFKIYYAVFLPLA